MRPSTLAFLPALVLIPTAHAAPPGKTGEPSGNAITLSDIMRCRSITSSEDRLACFDKRSATLAAATNTGDLVVIDRQEVQRTRRSLFGFKLPQLSFLERRRGEEKEHEADGALKQLDTTIADVSAYGFGFWTLALTEGGTWRTSETNRALLPTKGQPISIRRGPLGGYLAMIGKRQAVRITRIG